MRYNILRDEVEFFIPETSEVKDEYGSIKGFIHFSENETYYLYKDSTGNLQMASNSGSRKEVEYDKRESYSEWRYYE